MGIKVFVHDVIQNLGQRDLPCSKCNAQLAHRLTRTYRLTTLIVFPTAGSHTRNLARLS